eukprot:gene2069-16279_t
MLRDNRADNDRIAGRESTGNCRNRDLLRGALGAMRDFATAVADAAGRLDAALEDLLDDAAPTAGKRRRRIGEERARPSVYQAL